MARLSFDTEEVPVADRRSVLAQAASELQTAVEMLDACLNELGDQLQPVRSPIPKPVADGSAKEPMSSHSTLTNQINATIRTIRSMRSYVQEIQESLDL